LLLMALLLKVPGLLEAVVVWARGSSWLTAVCTLQGLHWNHQLLQQQHRKALPQLQLVVVVAAHQHSSSAWVLLVLLQLMLQGL
jgi:hypothetical protein